MVGTGGGDGGRIWRKDLRLNESTVEVDGRVPVVDASEVREGPTVAGTGFDFDFSFVGVFEDLDHGKIPFPDFLGAVGLLKSGAEGEEGDCDELGSGGNGGLGCEELYICAPALSGGKERVEAAPCGILYAAKIADLEGGGPSMFFCFLGLVFIT